MDTTAEYSVVKEQDYRLPGQFALSHVLVILENLTWRRGFVNSFNAITILGLTASILSLAGGLYILLLFVYNNIRL